jgi:hypothetical protein
MKPTLLYILSLVCSAVGHLDAQSSCPITVPVIGFNEKTGATIDPLSTSEFRARFNGREIPIRAIANPPATQRIIFVLDRSGSMTYPWSNSADHPKILANQALSEAVSAIPNRDVVAFLAFADKFSQQTEFMTPDSAKAKLPDILAWNPGKNSELGTPLWDNIDAALKMLNIHASGDTIVVISDGGDQMSKLSRSQLEDKLLAAGVQVFAIVVTNSWQTPSLQTPEEAAGPPTLAEFAETTGGAFVIVDRPLNHPDPKGHSPDRASQMLSLLAYQYHLTIEVPVHKPGKLRLTLNGANAGKEIRLLYPQVLYSCAVQ